MHQQIYLLLFVALVCSGSGPNQIFFKRQFHNVPFNYFTYQGHGTGYYREDTGINDIIIAGDKNEYPHL